MSSSLSSHFSPALLPLPAFPAWQQAGSTFKERALLYRKDLYKVWDNALQFRREVCVDPIEQANAVPQDMIVLTQSHTGFFAQEVVIVKQRGRQAVTAMRTLDSEVALISWRVNADGSLLRTGSNSLSLPGVQQVKMVHARNYVVACRTDTGDVHLSRWDVSNTGAIYLADSHHAAIQQSQCLEMAALTPELIVTLSLTRTQTWQLLLWQLQGDSDLKLLQGAELPAATINSCGLAVLPQRDGTLRWATVVSETPTLLALHLWQSTPEAAMTLVATHRIMTAPLAAVLVAHVDPHYLQLVVQSVTGQLHLLTCRLVTEEEVVVDDHGPLVSDAVRQCTCQPHPAGFTLVNYTDDGVLQAQCWQQQPDGTVLLLGTGHRATAPLVEVTCCDAPLEGNAPLLTSMIDAQDEVILTTWR